METGDINSLEETKKKQKRISALFLFLSANIHGRYDRLSYQPSIYLLSHQGEKKGKIQEKPVAREPETGERRALSEERRFCCC